MFPVLFTDFEYIKICVLLDYSRLATKAVPLHLKQSILSLWFPHVLPFARRLWSLALFSTITAEFSRLGLSRIFLWNGFFRMQQLCAQAPPIFNCFWINRIYTLRSHSHSGLWKKLRIETNIMFMGFIEQFQKC